MTCDRRYTYDLIIYIRTLGDQLPTDSTDDVKVLFGPAPTSLHFGWFEKFQVAVACNGNPKSKKQTQLSFQ